MIDFRASPRRVNARIPYPMVNFQFLQHSHYCRELYDYTLPQIFWFRLHVDKCCVQSTAVPQEIRVLGLTHSFTPNGEPRVPYEHRTPPSSARSSCTAGAGSPAHYSRNTPRL